MNENEAKTLIERFAEKQQGGHFACPRCGKMAMDAEIVTRNALSRRAYLRCLRHGGGAGRHDGGSAAADRMGYRLRAGELAHEAALLRRSVGA